MIRRSRPGIRGRTVYGVLPEPKTRSWLFDCGMGRGKSQTVGPMTLPPTPWRRRIDRPGLARKAWRSLEPRGRAAKFARKYGPPPAPDDPLNLTKSMARYQRAYSDAVRGTWARESFFARYAKARR